MSIKTILVPLEDCDATESMLETAWYVAEQFGGYVEGLYIKRALSGVVVADIGGYAVATADLVESFEEEDRQRGQRVRARFEDFVRGKGVILGGAATGKSGASANWYDDNAPGDAAAGMHARLFDLTVVGRPVSGLIAPATSTLETILFESGRPILIAPPAVPSPLTGTAVIAWNGSTETARTIAHAMPFLAAAKKIVVLAVEGVMVPGPTAAEVAQYLRHGGTTAEAREVAAGSRSGGEAILAEATNLGANLLIKGAYTHSRLRQMIFGGATSHILAAAELPVLMAH
ncbi:MAG: universal stress protein [Alphaproteobacteria bacterium]